jgi:hypothetical protein
MPINEDARALAEVMLSSGREPFWAVLVVGWYYGDQGRTAALELLNERGIDQSRSAF